MKNIINILIGTFTVFFVAFSLFGYLEFFQINNENEVETLNKVVRLLSYGLLFLILTIVLVIVKIRDEKTDKLLQQETNNQEDTEDVVIEKKLSISERIQPVIHEFTNDLKKITNKTDQEKNNNLLQLIVRKMNADIGMLYKSTAKKMVVLSSYAYTFEEDEDQSFNKSEGLIGEVVKTLKPLNIKDVPEGYITVITGLGESYPRNILLMPILNKNNKLIGIIELAALKNFSDYEEKLLEQLCLLIVKEIEK